MTVAIRTPSVEQQLQEVEAYCDMWGFTLDLFHIGGTWYWAIVNGGEPVHLGVDSGYWSRSNAIHDAWRHIWPGRQVTCR